MSRIGCGKAVEEAAATKRGVWLAPVEGSVLAYSLALTPALALGARPSTSALTLALALALAPLPHRVLTSPSCSESCEEILVVLVGPRLRFMEMTNSRRARRATAPTRDIADIAPCSAWG